MYSLRWISFGENSAPSVATAGPTPTATTLSGLRAAITAAADGDILDVALGAPAFVNLDGLAKTGTYGVYIRFDPAQIMQASIRGGSQGLHLYGGILAGDVVAGNVTASNYSLNMNNGSSQKISLNGVKFDRGYMGAVVATGVQDIIFQNCTFEYHRNDAVQMVGTTRAAFINNRSGPVAKGIKTCWFNNGDSPVYDISEPSCLALPNAAGWSDPFHNDVVQSYGGTTDLLHDGWDIETEGAGLVSFGSAAADGTQVRRVLIRNNRVRVSDTNAIRFNGSDITIYDNDVADHPDGAIGNTAINISRNNAVVGYANIAGGRNVAEAIIQPAGSDLGGTEITGDPAVLPDPPQIVRAPWAPSVPPRPALSPDNIAPENVTLPGIGDNSPNYFTALRGTWIGANGATWSYQWFRNGVEIPDATLVVYAKTGADIGQQLQVGVRATNDFGTGPVPPSWAMSAAIVPV